MARGKGADGSRNPRQRRWPSVHRPRVSLANRVIATLTHRMTDDRNGSNAARHSTRQKRLCKGTRRMRRYRALLGGQGTSIADLYWAGCIINMMSGFDLRQA